MNAPTYALNPGDGTQSNYLNDVSNLLSEVQTKGKVLQSTTAAFDRYVAQTNPGVTRSHEEYLFELLLFGVLWRSRGPEVKKAHTRHHGLIVELVRERRDGSAKRRDGSTSNLLDFEYPLERGKLNPSLQDFRDLLDWLLATGEYDDEVRQLSCWLKFFETRPFRIETTLQLIVAIASDFEIRSKSYLGKYTSNVNHFLLNELRLRQGREDAIQVSRRRLEYHVNMLGAELLNRAWRNDFLACDQHVVVLPGCTRSACEAHCRAVRSDTELTCDHCNKNCGVSRATELARRHGIPVVAVVHGSDFSLFLRAAAARGKTVGIVGVACAPGLLGAGYRARALGLPAQCVLLDSSGCAHWNQSPSPSQFDPQELEVRMTGAERGPALTERYEPIPAIRDVSRSTRSPNAARDPILST